MLVMLTSTAFYAQSALARSRTAYYLQVNGMRGPQNSSDDPQHNEQQIHINSMADLPNFAPRSRRPGKPQACRRRRPRLWRTRINRTLRKTPHHASLRGKSGQEVASMLQSALAEKDHVLADQTLIEYERIEAKLGANVSPASQH